MTRVYSVGGAVVFDGGAPNRSGKISPCGLVRRRRISLLWGSSPFGFLSITFLFAFNLSSSATAMSTSIRAHATKPAPTRGRCSTLEAANVLAWASRCDLQETKAVKNLALRGAGDLKLGPVEPSAEILQSSGTWVACPLPGCSSFVEVAKVAPESSAEMSCSGCGGAVYVTSAVTTRIKADARRVFRRFCPLDLPLILPSVEDARDSVDDDTLFREPLLRGDSTLPSWTINQQDIQLIGGAIARARLILADQEAGVVQWVMSPHEGGVPITEHVVLAAVAESGEVVDKNAATLTDVSWRVAVAAGNANLEAELLAERKRALQKVMKLIGHVSADNPVLEVSFLTGVVDTESGTTEFGRFDAEEIAVLDVPKNVWEKRSWASVRAGDVVRIEKLGHFPTDLLLLHASTPSEVCIETSCWDGDGSLRQWQVAPMSFTGADKAARTDDPTALHVSLNALGNGDPAALDALRKAGKIKAQPLRHPADWDQWSAQFEPSEEGGADVAHFGFRQLLPHNGRLVVTDWVLGLALAPRTASSFMLVGGWAGMERAKIRREQQEMEDKKFAEAARQAQVLRESKPVVPSDYEAETGVRWRAVFTDVPDDGNCLMHAVWKGLGELLKHYPSLRFPGEAELPANAVLFREQVIREMGADSTYRAAVANQLQLWLSIDCDLLFGLEDFFCLPPTFQSQIVDMNMQVQQAGVDPSTLDMPPLVDAYVASLSEVEQPFLDVLVVGSQVADSWVQQWAPPDVQEDSGRKFFLPLGELELEALCRNLHIRLQVVKTESLEVIAAASKRVHPVDEMLVEEVATAVLPKVTAMKAEGSVVDALDLVLVYLNNIAENPAEDKFRAIKAINGVLQRKVTSHAFGKDLLRAVGFTLDVEAGSWIFSASLEKLAATCRVLQDALATEGELSRAIDPRTIGPVHIYDRIGGFEDATLQAEGSAEANSLRAQRIVRILNVRTNHYQVHLPRQAT